MIVRRNERSAVAAPTSQELSGEALEFVRFCYRRRRVPWPEIYDDMSAVAARRLFRGWGFAELAEQGIAFTIAELPRLAALVDRVVQEERGAGRRPDGGDGTSVETAPAMSVSGALKPG